MTVQCITMFVPQCHTHEILHGRTVVKSQCTKIMYLTLRIFILLGDCVTVFHLFCSAGAREASAASTTTNTYCKSIVNYTIAQTQYHMDEHVQICKATV